MKIENSYSHSRQEDEKLVLDTILARAADKHD